MLPPPCKTTVPLPGGAPEGVSGTVGFCRLGTGVLPGGGGCKHQRLVSGRKAVPREGPAAVALHKYVNIALPNRSNRAAADNGDGLTINAYPDGSPLHARFSRDSIELGTVRNASVMRSTRPDQTLKF